MQSDWTPIPDNTPFDFHIIMEESILEKNSDEPFREWYKVWKEALLPVRNYAMYKNGVILVGKPLDHYRKIHQNQNYNIAFKVGIYCRRATPADFIKQRIIEYALLVGK